MKSSFELLKPKFFPTAAGLVYASNSSIVARCDCNDPATMPVINDRLLTQIGLPSLNAAEVLASMNQSCIFVAVCPNGRGFDTEHVFVSAEFPFALKPEIDTKGALCVVGLKDWFPKMNTALPALLKALRAESAKQKCDRLLLLTTPDQRLHVPSMLEVTSLHDAIVPGKHDDSSVAIFTIPVPAN